MANLIELQPVVEPSTHAKLFAFNPVFTRAGAVPEKSPGTARVSPLASLTAMTHVAASVSRTN